MMNIKQTENQQLLNDILDQLKKNNNYCPCSLTQTPDDKCMCKKFRDIISANIPGEYECDCGRYIVKID